MATLEEHTQHAEIVSLTERAAVKVRELMAEEPAGEAEVLRIAIQGGGCSGFEYALGFDRGTQHGDLELELHGVRVVVDPFSAPYLRGASIDFLDGLQESGFKIDNPNVVAACGCGSSFQPKDEIEGTAGDAAVGHGTPEASGGCAGCG